MTEPTKDDVAATECHICHRPLTEDGEIWCSAAHNLVPVEPSATTTLPCSPLAEVIQECRRNAETQDVFLAAIFDDAEHYLAEYEALLLNSTLARPHKAEPTPWVSVPGDEWTLTRMLHCRFCKQPIQRRGLLRRWQHVV